MMKGHPHRRIAWLAAMAAAFLLTACGMKTTDRFAGRTMGTTYHVQLAVSRFERTAYLAERIEARLIEINRSMSTYLPDSEISRFNAMGAAHERICVSRDFFQVMTVAANLFRLTAGAWDGTVAPLVNLWGFGVTPQKGTVPTAEQIDRVLERVGFDRILKDPGGCLSKSMPNVTLDLASIAKGYGVDAVADLIRAEGYNDFLVEIGGEVFASGHRTDGKPWRVGINHPDPSAPANQVYRAVSLTGKALATSGDYRNFFIQNDVRYSHLIDPRSGYPVQNGVVSASVIAPTCTLADGLATALAVMGPESGLALVNALDGVDCLIVVRDAQGRLIDYVSGGFRPYETQ
ncbi:MAG: FAD:protein FMN transferase [Desulfobacterales bacterium]|nr:FAD:protein FMN transferase [Desulfobacterales bacterium]